MMHHTQRNNLSSLGRIIQSFDELFIFFPFGLVHIHLSTVDLHGIYNFCVDFCLNFAFGFVGCNELWVQVNEKVDFNWKKLLQHAQSVGLILFQFLMKLRSYN